MIHSNYLSLLRFIVVFGELRRLGEIFCDLLRKFAFPSFFVLASFNAFDLIESLFFSSNSSLPNLSLIYNVIFIL